ncbi:nicotinate (nicotinamide) nucleotide adenylyltransferase [Phormidium pseudopriestleyi FRX01]|uniref:Probable nicotinate-nucleotide adenylyltransferase n=1 Tax=Phormidium pseudopriestleyi FRX01 TaxID=1759528 RepID=A0ABS3FSR7_9CYAN|nr:nicotinate (nicotinamide) nucleotide adenylyltransferase [Phormidium pseudopriestleyi]MBO0349838.1 nicotinate (nicotinamide) nucleotide adenylyltransferase [Phormidium pseudopriestleyi FRX01]
MQQSPIKKRAILGGTFDPIHWGHLGIAYAALEQVGLNQIIWVSDRHKRDPHQQSQVEFEHRQEMVRLAIAPEKAFDLGPPPSEDPKAGYAIVTWQTLQQRYPDSQWYWIIGADAFATLPKWDRAAELVEACEWLVAPRSASDPGLNYPEETPLFREISPLNLQQEPPQLNSTVGTNPSTHLDNTALIKTEEICQQVAIAFKTRQIHLRWQILQSQTLPIASTLLRRHWCDWPKIRTWVPKPVQIYIQTHHLYQNPQYPLPPHSTSLPRL